MKRASFMAKFTARDYTDYNNKYCYYQYGYLHRLLDLLYNICKFYKLKYPGLVYWISDTGNQAELKNTMYFNVKKRIFLHQKVFKYLWSKRYSKSRLNF